MIPLPSLPSGWRYIPVKRAAHLRFSTVNKHSVPGETDVLLCNYVDVYRNERITSALTFMAATASTGEIARFSLTRGDVLLTKDSETPDDIGVPSCVVDDLRGVVCGYHLAMLRPRSFLDGRFLHRALQASGVRDQFHSTATGVTRFGLGLGDVGDALVPLPPLREQRAIADFVDRKTAVIDALIWKKEMQGRLLVEKQAALVTATISRGLDRLTSTKQALLPCVPVQIPAHWTIKRLKNISPRQSVGVVVNPSDYYSDSGIPFLFGNNVIEGGFIVDGVRRVSPGSNRLLAKSMLRAGDLVTVRVGAPGVTAVIPGELDGCNCASMMIIRQSPSFDSQWLRYCMNSRIGRAQVEAVQYGAAQKQFNISDAVEFAFPVPPLAEQRAIVDFLNGSSAECDSVKSALADQMAALREYRQALITAAVTGQIDVARGSA